MADAIMGTDDEPSEETTSMADGHDTIRPITVDDDSLDDEQRAVHDAIVASPRGGVHGPLRVWLLSPALADRAQSLGAFCRFGTSLPPRLSELAILVMGSHWRAGFEWFAHEPMARAAGVNAEATEAIRRGETPELPDDERAVYEFSHELIETHEVSDDTYAAAIATLGQRGVVDLVGILGYYSLISMTINAFRIPVPEGAIEPFADL